MIPRGDRFHSSQQNLARIGETLVEIRIAVVLDERRAVKDGYVAWLCEGHFVSVHLKTARHVVKVRNEIEITPGEVVKGGKEIRVF